MQQMNKNEYDFGLLYTFYAIPNTFMPFIIGILFDTVGTRKVLFATMLVTLLGQYISMQGAYDQNFTQMIIGRTIFGLGCESLYNG